MKNQENLLKTEPAVQIIPPAPPIFPKLERKLAIFFAALFAALRIVFIILRDIICFILPSKGGYLVGSSRCDCSQHQTRVEYIYTEYD